VLRCQRHRKVRQELLDIRRRQRARHVGELRALLPWLDRQQKQVAAEILSVARKVKAFYIERLAAIETALVETALRNLPYGHGTSVGWRQEIDTYGPVSVRLDVRAVAYRFFAETRAADPLSFSSAGQLAQAVQRSAHPGRYDERYSEAVAILAWFRAVH
jgi:hypothetical protein